ncbi:MAG TPA: response regulator [Bryobacteraceae bacterium]|jgi:PAS domain S-box-containing protein|nr:response regulator [Bryobacteraceae bacterium]
MLFTQTRAKVLVVDDEPSILTSIADLLESDFHVITTTEPLRGLDHLASEEISVLISDQRMPSMNGDQFLHIARDRSSATRVLLTGFADIEALARVVNNGKIYAYVTKPWDPLALRTTIRNAANEYNLMKTVRYERDLLRTLVDSIPDCVYVQDSAQCYTVVNRAFAKLCGMENPWQATGKTELECLPGEFGRKAWADGYKILQTGVPIIGQCHEWKNEDGTARWYSSTRVPIRGPIDNCIAGLVGVSTDITEQKQIEQNLRAAKELAEQTVRAKQEFLARISHEIRTPLNSVLGMTELLSETDLSEQQRKYVGISRTNGETLMRLLNDLLDLARSDLNELRLAASDFDPRDVLSIVIESYEEAAAANRITLRSRIGDNVPGRVNGDPERLKQILSNLVNNGLKFTRQGGILVEMTGAPVANETVLMEFAVADTGIGIAADQIDHIFEPFSQAEEFKTGKYGGAGLGLAICRQLAHQMGGSIWVESAPGAGSTFRFTARLRVVSDQPGAEASAKELVPNRPGATASFSDTALLAHRAANQKERTQGALAGLRVLLADDNEDNLFLLQSYLCHTKVQTASNGREALDQFVAGKFDIVFMDLGMPEMDGLEATRLIREWERRNLRTPTPILAFTAHEDVQEASLEAGCNGHLVKPLPKDALLAALAKYCYTPAQN